MPGISTTPISRLLRALGAIAMLFGIALSPPQLVAQTLTREQSFRVGKATERLELVVSTSRVLTLESKVPQLFVSDPSVIQATPLSPNQVQVSGLKPGVAQLSLWDDKGSSITFDVIVTPNAAELIELLRTEFPEAVLHVRPLNTPQGIQSTVYVAGFVPSAGMMDGILRLSQGYYQNVINGVTVGGVQQVALHTKVMEVSRSKLRRLGLDWEVATSSFSLTQGAAGVLSGAAGGAAIPGTAGADTVRLKVSDSGTDFRAFLDALRRHDLVKLLAEPTLVTMTGRPARFNSGGQIPVLKPGGLGTVNVEYKDYGTSIDFVPTVLANGMIRLEVRPSVSEIDESRGIDMNGIKVPALRSRYADTAVELRAGQTLALAGLIQNRVESHNTGIPFFADLPWLGRAFSHVEEKVNEVELLILVTPELIGPIDPHQLPNCGPGQLTASPSDCELYWFGYPEVPNCCLQGQSAQIRNGRFGPSSADALTSGDRAELQHNSNPHVAIPVTPPGGRPESVLPPIQSGAPPGLTRQPAPNSGSSEVFGALGYDPLR
jgi:pilus assembly protein CpaC